MTEMDQNGTSKAKGPQARSRRLALFARNEDGSIVIFALFMFVLMVAFSGMAVDFMRHEHTRVSLQNTLDRAVLAAADLEQELDAKAVVTDYFVKAGLGDYLTGIDVDEGLNYKKVSATAVAEVDTIFSNLLGVQSIDAPAMGTAEERVENVEISMVLDISGSMRSNSKMANLRAAASDFVDTVITSDTKDQVSVTLVPYTAQVNAGPDIYNEMNMVSLHNYSHCVRFEPTDFSNTRLSLTTEYTQMQHFQYEDMGKAQVTNPTCPMRTYERITLASQDRSALKNQINQLQPRSFTAIHMGMKWGVAALDPSMRPVYNKLINAGKVDGAFAGRPMSYDDNETLKTVVLMTDGANVASYLIQDWAYNEYSEIVHWATYPLWYYLNRIPSYYHNSIYETDYTATQADGWLNSVCSAAKDKGIVVWAVGFEVGDAEAQVMENCASTPSHFFRVSGTEIRDAFNAIGRQINQLRLTQ